MKRRDFIRTSAALAAAGSAGLLTAGNVFAADDPESSALSRSNPDKAPETPDGKLIISAPVLQNYAPGSMGVAFAVSALANGYVLLSENSDMSGSRKIMCGGYRVTDIDDAIIRVRLTGLSPAKRYYYRIGADRISYKGGYRMKVIGNEEDERVYSFVTAGEQADAHFCVINDTHARWEPFGRALDKIAALSPSCVIWNGDASNTEETVQDQVRIFFRPEVTRSDYASCTPYLLCPGNHDSRGMANRHLERAWMFRQSEERSPRDWDLGRNFAVRMGETALIGLDTAEDKLDTNPVFAGLFNSGVYRQAQTEWLRDALQRPEIASAPFLVAFCHIPLYDDIPFHNPGDVAPADSDPAYTTDYAMWQRTCGKMWGPLLSDAGCRLVISAHQHRYRRMTVPGQSWIQLVGGGPEMGVFYKGDSQVHDSGKFPTIIEGKVSGGKLQITVHNLLTGKVQDTFQVEPR